MKLNKLVEKVKRKFGVEIVAKTTEQAIVLEGEMDDWEKIVQVGYLFVGKSGKRRVVNNIRLKDAPPKAAESFERDSSLEGKEYDVVVIGGGITGLAILRELSRYPLKLLLLEKEADVARGASGANDGMIHAGIDLKKGTLKWKYCLAGNRLYGKLAEELDFPFKRCGQYIVYGSLFERLVGTYILFKGRRLKVPGVRRVSREELLKAEPELTWAKGAIQIACTGVTSPYEACVALAENAIENGAEIALETACLGFTIADGGIKEVETNRGRIRAKVVINAAGVFADEVAKMAGDQFYSIHPRKGTDLLFDNKLKLLNSAASPIPTLKERKSRTKGGTLVLTCEGNILAGPDAVEVPDKTDTGTPKESVDRVFGKHSRVLPKLKESDIIAYFSGLRAATYEEDFIVEGSRNLKNFIHVAGIQSPGLTAAPAIALDVAEMVVKMLGDVEPKKDFKSYRKRIPRVKDLPLQERQELIKADPDFGKIVCRCEEVSLGEIKAAIRRPLPARTVDAIKRRVRAGMGRCQGGFCLPNVLKTLAEELDMDYLEVTKKGKGSEICLLETKGGDSDGV